jgi:serine phosphatase RsbU (regulator of sigma subunit)
MLKNFGYEFGFIAKPELLFQRLETETFDLVLLDIHMSGNNGLELLHLIKTHIKLNYIDVIMITGETDDNILAKSLELGAADYVRKPIREVILKARIRNVLERQRLMREISQQNAALAQQQQEISTQKDIAQKAVNNLKSSLNYAYRIQNIMLPETTFFKKLLPESFILFKPRDIVSGDFYWIAQKNNKIMVVVADCTGHGVPGAFMSMIGLEQLTEIVEIESVEEPHLILEALHNGIKKILRQEKTSNRDGMDISICVIDKASMILEFAGAKQPLAFIQTGEGCPQIAELTTIRGAILPVGGVQIEDSRIFVKHSILLAQNTKIRNSIFYMHSDGYQDQFGGENDRKFTPKRLRELLFAIHQKPMEEQQQILNENIDVWINGGQQLDDILVMGFKIDENVFQYWKKDN